MVQLNRAVAVAMRDGPQAGLLRTLGRTTEAAAAYRAALELGGNERERAFLGKKLTEL